MAINLNTGGTTVQRDPRTGKTRTRVQGVGYATSMPGQPAKWEWAQDPWGKGNVGKRYMPNPAGAKPPGGGGSQPPTGDSGPGYLSGPGYGETFWLRNWKEFEKPGAAEDFWNANQGKFAQPWQGSTYWDQNKAQFEQPWQGERTLGAHLEGMFAPGAGEQYNSDEMKARVAGIGSNALASYQDMQRRLGGRQDAGKFFDETRQQYLDESFRETAAKGLLPTVPQLSYSEDLYESGKGEDGLTRYYGREWDKTSNRLNNELASRGIFNSGAGLRLLEEGAADISAQQAKEMAAMANQADLARSLRLKDIMGVSEGGDTGKLSRLGAGQESARVAGDQERAAAEAIAAAAARADEFGVSRENLLREGAFGAQDRELARRATAIKGADLLDNLRGRRIGLGADIAFGAGREDLSRFLGGGTLARGADVSKMGRLTAGGQLSQGAQELFEGRLTGEFMNNLLLGKAQAGVFEGMSREMAQEQYDIAMDKLRTQLRNREIDAQQYERAERALNESFSIAMRGLDQGGGEDIVSWLKSLNIDPSNMTPEQMMAISRRLGRPESGEVEDAIE